MTKILQYIIFDIVSFVVFYTILSTTIDTEPHKVLVLEKYTVDDQYIIKMISLDTRDSSDPFYYREENVDRIYNLVEVNKTYNVTTNKYVLMNDNTIYAVDGRSVI